MRGSPFRVFRKHQRLLMALLIGLAMFAFVFLGSLPSLGSAGAQGLIPLVFVLLGAAAFWLVGTQMGNPSTYALVGAVIGAAVGLWFPKLGGPKPAVETSVGSISPRELQLLVRKRNVANQFIQRIYAEGFPPPDSQSNPMIRQLMLQFWQQGLENVRFRINPRLPVERDVVLGYLLRKEADRLGITVSDEVVTNHIKQVSRGKLSTQRFREILAEMGLTENQLYDILRDELKAQLALQLLAPPAFETPHEQWENYRKLNVRASIEVAVVNVEEFLSQVPDPPEDELRSFFEQYKEHFPGELDPAAPGFRQPRRLQLAYVEADRRSMEKKIKPVTDEDIRRFYEENKDELYRLPPVSTKEGSEASQPAAETGKQQAEQQPGSGKTGGQSGVEKPSPQQPTSQQPGKAGAAQKTDGTTGPDKQSSQSERPSERQQSAQPAPQGRSESKPKQTDKPSQPSKQPEGSSKKAPSSKKAGGADAQFSVGPQAVQKQQEGASEKPSPSQKGSGTKKVSGDQGSGTGQSGKAVPAASQTKSQPNKAANKPTGQAADAGSQQRAPGGSRSDTSAAKAAGQPSKPTGSQPQSKSAGSGKSAESAKKSKLQGESGAEAKKGSSAEAAEPGAKAPGSGKKAEAEKKAAQPQPPRYRPLDESLKEEIRLRLIEQRVDEAIRQAINDVQEKMRELGARHASEKTAPDHLEPEQVSAELRRYAASRGLHYEETPPLSARELSESQDYPIGQAVELLEGGGLGTETVVDRLFGMETAFLFTPDVAEDPITGSRFAYWVVKEIPAHVPKFDEPGIRDQVLKAWKLLRARPKAEKRAQQLAELASKALSSKGSAETVAAKEQGKKDEKDKAGKTTESARSLADVLKGQTVTGQKDAPPVPVHTVPEFSWLTVTTPSVPPLNPFQPPPTAVQLTDLAPSVAKAGERFMETVFRKLKPGEVGVAPNADQTVYYVVYLKSRSDSDPTFEEQLRERFLKENPFASQPLQRLASAGRGEIYFRWLEQLQERFQVQWNELEEQSGPGQP